MVRCKGLSGSGSYFGFRFHLPVLGGWRQYVVLEPEDTQDWYVGWILSDAIGISRIKLIGPVRLLIGPDDVSFFGINGKDYGQIPIRKIGEGRIGSGGSYAQMPLL